MLQQTLMFLAAGSPSQCAATRNPPAVAADVAAAVSPPAGRRHWRLRQVVAVAADAAGFAILLAALWYVLWLAQALI
jgi:hypothetical protein